MSAESLRRERQSRTEVAAILLFAIAAGVCAQAQNYNRGIRESDIQITSTSTAGIYSIRPSARILNVTAGSLNLGTRFDVAVNGDIVGSLTQGIIAPPTGQTCGGSCTTPVCPAGSTCESFAVIGQDGCSCAVIITPGGGAGILAGINPGDFVSVQLIPANGAVSEVHTADDFAQLSFLGCASTVAGYTSERFGALPNDRMQVVAYYDGDGAAELDIHLVNPATNSCCIVTIAGIPNSPFSVQEYAMNGFVPTGKFVVRNVVPNGVVDGVAFGLYWRDTIGARWKLQSRSSTTGSGTPNFVGIWPYSWSDATFDAAMPTIVDDGFKRRQAQTTLSGAQVLGNGTWGIPTGRVPADTNGDGCVDLSDLATLLSAFGSCCP